MPIDNWPYDRPVDPWKDDREFEETIAASPVLFEAVRRVTDDPEAGDPRLSSWSDWHTYVLFVRPLDGVDGRNQNSVRVYKRAAEEPGVNDRPDDSVYNFVANTLTYASGDSNNGWTIARPAAGDGIIWSRLAHANSREETDQIPSRAWSQPVHDEGADGINTAPIILQQRSAMRPDAPSRTLTYTFATQTLAPAPDNGWIHGLPAKSDLPYARTTTLGWHS